LGSTCGPNGATCEADAGCVTPSPVGPPAPPPAPPHCSGNDEVIGSETISCGDFACDHATGTCPTACRSNLDCVAGRVCAAGACVAFATSPAPSTGSCSASGAPLGSSRSAPFGFLAALALAAVRRRRGRQGNGIA
jgi:MYXO-CTERM domain-containing protein